MKITILQENLIKSLGSVARIVSAKAQLPILANILMTTEGGRLRLSATNMEIGMHCWAGAKIEEEGSFTVPAKVFLEFVSSLPKDKIEITTEDNSLWVRSNGCEASFNGIPATEFPPVPVFPEEKLFSIEGKDFVEAIQKVSFASATDEGRPVLTGVLFNFTKDDLVLAGTDGYRLSTTRLKNPLAKEKKENKEMKIILPARTLLETTRCLLEKESVLNFAILKNGNQAVFSMSSTQIVSQLLGGEYPAYEKIIPTETTTKTAILTEDLFKAVKTASIFARDNANIVKFTIRGEELVVTANTSGVGTNKSTVAIKKEGEDSEIAFNSRYLLDFLNCVKDGEISFEMTGPLNPGIFKKVKDENFLHVIMPVRVQT